MCHGKDFAPHAMHGCLPFMGKDFPVFMGKIGKHIQECMGKFGSWLPHNVEDRGDSYVITVPLPGRSKEDVNVSLIGNSLNIKANKPKTDNKESKEDNSEKTGRQFFRYFFSFIDADMDIPLPPDADLDSIKSVMTNGLLKIKIGKKPAKKVDISTEGNN